MLIHLNSSEPDVVDIACIAMKSRALFINPIVVRLKTFKQNSVDIPWSVPIGHISIVNITAMLTLSVVKY